MDGTLQRLLISSRYVNKHRQFFFWLVDFVKSSPLKQPGQINEKLGKKHLWKVLYQRYGHHRQFLFLVGRFLKVLSSETAWRNTANLYRKHLWKVLYMISSFHADWIKTWSPRAILVSDWLKFIKILSSETRRHNELLLCRNYVWEILTQFPYFVPITQPIWPPYNQFLFMINQLKEIFSKTIWPN
jgi:hypothetical protein